MPTIAKRRPQSILSYLPGSTPIAGRLTGDFKLWPAAPRSSILETRARRLALPIQKKPQAPLSIGRGLTLLYRRCKGPGRWVVKVADGRGGNWEKTLPSAADDAEQADGEHILNFWEACEKARSLARSGRGGRPEMVSEAIDSYEKDLRANGRDDGNAKRVRFHLPTWFLNKPVGMTTAGDFRRWRDDMLAKGTKGATLARIIKPLRAALNLAARNDRRIVNQDAWRGDALRLAGIADTFNARNVILVLSCSICRRTSFSLHTRKKE